MNKNKIVKSLLILVLVLFSGLTLSACGGNSTKYPTGSIDDSVYASAGDHKVTNKELYNEFRFDSLSILQTLLDQKSFSKYFEMIDYANEDHRKLLEESINEAVFGNKDIEELQKNIKKDASKEKQVRSYIDSLLIVGKIKPSEKDNLLNLLFNTETYNNYPDVLLDVYKQKLAVRLFAKEKLDEELKDEESKQFIKDEEIVTYYKNNRQGKYKVTAFYTEFINLAEQRAVFRELSLKISSGGKWFLVPDIRITDSAAPGYVDLENPNNKHVKDILVNKEIKYVDDADARVEISKDDFETYYNAYQFNENRAGNPDTPFDKEQVIEYMIKAHNLVHSQQLELVDAATGEIKVVGGEAIKTTFEYDDFKEASLRNHIYTAIKIPKDADDTNVQYSQRPNTFGEYVYLAYKFSDESATEEGVLNEDKDKFLDGNDELIAELKAEIAEKRLSDTYINEKVNELRKDQKLNIYDPVIRHLYSQSNEYKGSTKFKDNNTLATIGDDVITVDEFFKEAETAFGVSVANDLLVNKLLREKYYGQITKEEHKKFQDQMKQMIISFGQNQFAQSGFPASLGRADFLLYAFRATSLDEAIEKAYVMPKVVDLHNKDLEGQYDDIYTKFADLSALQYENYWLLRSSHILVYLDRNLDGTPDNPQKDLTAEELAEAQAMLPALASELFKRISKETTEQKGIERLITDFNDSTRLESDSEYDKESIWAPFKRFGFKLKNETLGEITNSSNFLSSQSRLDEVFYARAQALYEIVKDYKVAQFPYLDFYNGDVAFDPENPEVELGNIEKIQTAFGWHFIMATGVTNEMTSAKLAERDDDLHLSKITDKDGNPLSGVNENDVVNATQIEIYLKELNSEYNVQIRVSAAIQKQFGAVKSKYDSNQMKSEVKYRLLELNGLTFADNAVKDKFEGLRQINKDQLFDYQLVTSLTGNPVDPQFAALWGTWFDTFQ